MDNQDVARKNLILGLRLCMAVVVASTSVIAWLWLWVAPGIAVSVARFLDGGYLRSPVVVFGDVWQWIFGAACLLLVAALVSGWRRTLLAGTLWVAALIVLGIASTIQYGWELTSGLVVLCAIALLAGVNWLAMRAA